MTEQTKPFRLLLLGFGSVNQGLCRIILQKTKELKANGINLTITGVADSKGAIFNENGFDIKRLLDIKQNSQSVLSHRNSEDFSGILKFDNCLKMIKNEKVISKYDLLIDGSPSNYENGEPGISCVKQSLKNDKFVVLASKAPLVLDFDGIVKNKSYLRNKIGISATVCGGLPVINVLLTELLLNQNITKINKISGIFNSTTNYILTNITNNIINNKTNNSNPELVFNKSLKEAQRRGIAETDPTGDLNGNDTLSKLYIISKIVNNNTNKLNNNNLIQQYYNIKSLEHGMISVLNNFDIFDLNVKYNKCVKLIGKLERLKDNTWNLSVSTEAVSKDSFLGSCNGTDKCIQIESDLFETVYMKINEIGYIPTSSAVLRDILYIINQNKNKISKL